MSTEGKRTEQLDTAYMDSSGFQSPHKRRPKALSQVVASYMARKGLGKSHIAHDFRLQEALPMSPHLYDTPHPPRTPEQQLISLIFKTSPPKRASPRRKTKSIRSADEVVTVEYSEAGRILIPIKNYHRALQRYKGERMIMQRLNLRETEEMSRHFQRIAEVIAPSNKRESRTPRTPLTEGKTEFSLSDMKTLLKARRARSVTPVQR